MGRPPRRPHVFFFFFFFLFCCWYVSVLHFVGFEFLEACGIRTSPCRLLEFVGVLASSFPRARSGLRVEACFL